MFIILVSIYFNFLYIYLFTSIYYLFKMFFFITADKNGDYQATIDIGVKYVLVSSIIHFYSTSVNGNKSCRKKYLWII